MPDHEQPNRRSLDPRTGDDNDGIRHHLRELSASFRRIEHTQEEQGKVLRQIHHQQERFMANVQDFIDKALPLVTAEDSKIDSLIALTTELKRRVDEIVGGSITPAQQAQLDQIFAAVADNPDRVQAAIDANTPAA